MYWRGRLAEKCQQKEAQYERFVLFIALDAAM